MITEKIIDAYFSIPISWSNKNRHKCMIRQVNDNVPLDCFDDVLELYADKDKAIVVVRVPQKSVNAFKDNSDGLELTSISATAMKIDTYYLGKEYNDIFKRYIELKGTHKVSYIDENGKTIVKEELIVEDRRMLD